MQTGMTLEGLIDHVRRQAELSVDYVVPVPKLQFFAREMSEGKHQLQLAIEGSRNLAYVPDPWCGRQIAQKLEIPPLYYDRCLSHGYAQGLANHLNFWWAGQKDSRLVRTFGSEPPSGVGQARAFLGRRYRMIDNYPVLGTMLPLIQDRGLELISSNVSARNMYLQVVSQKLRGEVEIGDEVQWGLRIRNSEVGAASFEIESLIWRLRCKNGMIGESAIKRRHVGRLLDITEEGGVEFLQDDTLKADDHAFQLKVRDIVDGMLSEQVFRKQLGRLQEAAGRRIEKDPLLVVEIVQKRYDLSEIEAGLVRRNLIDGGRLTAWGLANAVTAITHSTQNVDRQAELEEIGGKIIDLTPAEWTKVAA